MDDIRNFMSHFSKIPLEESFVLRDTAPTTSLNADTYASAVAAGVKIPLGQSVPLRQLARDIDKALDGCNGHRVHTLLLVWALLTEQSRADLKTGWSMYNNDTEPRRGDKEQNKLSPAGCP